MSLDILSLVVQCFPFVISSRETDVSGLDDPGGLQELRLQNHLPAVLLACNVIQVQSGVHFRAHMFQPNRGSKTGKITGNLGPVFQPENGIENRGFAPAPSVYGQEFWIPLFQPFSTGSFKFQEDLPPMTTKQHGPKKTTSPGASHVRPARGYIGASLVHSVL